MLHAMHGSLAGFACWLRSISMRPSWRSLPLCASHSHARSVAPILGRGRGAPTCPACTIPAARVQPARETGEQHMHVVHHALGWPKQYQWLSALLSIIDLMRGCDRAFLAWCRAARAAWRTARPRPRLALGAREGVAPPHPPRPSPAHLPRTHSTIFYAMSCPYVMPASPSKYCTIRQPLRYGLTECQTHGVLSEPVPTPFPTKAA